MYKAYESLRERLTNEPLLFSIAQECPRFDVTNESLGVTVLDDIWDMVRRAGDVARWRDGGGRHRRSLKEIKVSKQKSI
jgi:hypothetical protein